GAVALSCAGLPSGASCTFTPSASVNPTSGTPVNVTLTIATSGTTPPGTYPITISAASSGAPSPKTQSVTLTVTNFPDYTLSVNAPSADVAVTDQVTVSGTVTAFNGYTNV